MAGRSPGRARLRRLASLVAVGGLVGCAVPGGGDVDGSVIRYVALGDSYTIGTSVAEDERWPDQLVERLARSGQRVALSANLGVNGYASADLIAEELPELEGLEPDFVTVLIGVNDVVRGVPEATYAENVETILDAVLDRLPAGRVVAVSTPDYTVTPQGAVFGNAAEQSDAIRRYNAIFRAAAEARGVAFVDIHDLSLRAATDETLVARDGLHPSGAQYALWVERIFPTVERLLSSE